MYYSIVLIKNFIASLFGSNTSFSENDRKELLIKLFQCLIGTVIFMMVVGAITRLTDSGLSIPEWPLINGTLMYPITDSDWNAVFETYKKYPQYKILFSTMTVSEFKYIFFFEYFHRSITTLVSFFLFLIGCVLVTGVKTRKKYMKHFLVIFALLIIQAFVGYYMVKSGLKENMARVSHLMLLFHLSTAMIFLTTIVWLYLRIKYENMTKVYHKFSKKIMLLFGFTFLQFMSGALVAGTKAGYHFSDWPLMNGKLIPDGLWAAHFTIFQNLFENIAMIQFTHRTLAYIITVLIFTVLLKLKKNTASKPLNSAIKFVLLFLSIQVALGIMNLWFHVPVALGALHQLCGILLLLTLFNLAFKLRFKDYNNE